MNIDRPQPDIPPEIMEAASAWAVRTSDPDFTDWDGFTDWLEASPAHLPAYDMVLARVDHAADLIATISVEADSTHPLHAADVAAGDSATDGWAAENIVELPAPRRRWWPAAAAIAASVAAVVGIGVMDRGTGQELIATAAGEHRVVELADGSRIIMNGATSLTIDQDNPRHIELAHGEALFEVRHDEANPFVVVADGTRLLDAGTVFNVVADQGRLDVAVAEGAVIYRPDQDAVRLNPGDGLSRASADAAPVLRKTNPEGVGTWQDGQLHYDGASLDQVARDLARNIGQPVGLRGGSSSARFSGTLALNGTPDEVFARIGPLLGVRFTASGEGWIMSPPNGSPR